MELGWREAYVTVFHRAMWRTESLLGARALGTSPVVLRAVLSPQRAQRAATYYMSDLLAQLETCQPLMVHDPTDAQVWTHFFESSAPHEKAAWTLPHLMACLAHVD